MRVVSLACSNTEIVCALGCAHSLVGVDDHSDYPDDVVRALPRVGPDLDIDVDAVAALDPDLVLATLTVPGHEKVVQRLEEAGLPFVAPEPVSLNDVYRDIHDIGAMLDAEERARVLVAEMRAELDPGERGVSARDRAGEVDPATEGRDDDGGTTPGPSILIQWWPKPVITPGRKSWATDVVRAAGGRALLGHEDHKSRPVTDDEVAELDPDAVVLSWCGVHPDKYRPDVVLRNERWQHLRFVRDRQVFCIGEPHLGRPGPRLVEGVRAMRRVVDAVRKRSGQESAQRP